jgi:hypothetical protein
LVTKARDIRTGDPKVDRAVAEVRNALNEATRSPLLGAQPLEGLSLTNAVRRIPHKLGRKPTGYMVTRTRSVTAKSEPAPAVYLFKGIDAATFIPTASSNWFAPNGANDFWEVATGTAQNMHIPLNLPGWARVRRIGLRYKKAASGGGAPSIVWEESFGAATASVVTPTVAWTVPAANTNYQSLTADYDRVAGIANNYQLRVQTVESGARIRKAWVEYELNPSAEGAPPDQYQSFSNYSFAVVDENDGKTDLDRYLYLKTVGASATVDLMVF